MRATQTGEWAMEEYDDEPDLEEQIFHNNVREQIVSTAVLNNFIFV